MTERFPGLTGPETVIASGLDPLILPLMLQHRHDVLAAGIAFILISGRRGSGEQARLHADAEARREEWVKSGRKGPEPRPALKQGGSKHELGLAYDFKGPLRQSQWTRAGELAEALGLESGHRYRRPDPGHVEIAEDIDSLRTLIRLRLAATAAAIGVVALALGGGRA